MKLEPSAILFDMDGVLVDTLNAWWLSLNISLKAFNYNKTFAVFTLTEEHHAFSTHLSTDETPIVSTVDTVSQ